MRFESDCQRLRVKSPREPSGKIVFPFVSLVRKTNESKNRPVPFSSGGYFISKLISNRVEKPIRLVTDGKIHRRAHTGCRKKTLVIFDNWPKTHLYYTRKNKYICAPNTVTMHSRLCIIPFKIILRPVHTRKRGRQNGHEQCIRTKITNFVQITNTFFQEIFAFPT